MSFRNLFNRNNDKGETPERQTVDFIDQHRGEIMKLPWNPIKNGGPTHYSLNQKDISGDQIALVNDLAGKGYIIAQAAGERGGGGGSIFYTVGRGRLRDLLDGRKSEQEVRTL